MKNWLRVVLSITGLILLSCFAIQQFSDYIIPELKKDILHFGHNPQDNLTVWSSLFPLYSYLLLSGIIYLFANIFKPVLPFYKDGLLYSFYFVIVGATTGALFVALMLAPFIGLSQAVSIFVSLHALLLGSTGCIGLVFGIKQEYSKDRPIPGSMFW